MTKAEAQAAYRAAWSTRCLATTREAQQVAEQAMDAAQPDCTDARRPGPEWEAFIATLPGYREHWGDLLTEANAHGARIFGKDWKPVQR